MARQATLDLAARELVVRPVKRFGCDMYAASNLAAARIIAKDSVRYQGLMQEWARLVIARWA